MRSPVKVVRMPIWIDWRGIDHAVADRIVEHRAVIDAAAIIGLDIAMRIEMHERQRAMHLGMGLEQRIGDEMIAAEGDHLGAGAR